MSNNKNIERIAKRKDTMMRVSEIAYNQHLTKNPLFKELKLLKYHNILCYEKFLISLQKLITINVC